MSLNYNSWWRLRRNQKNPSPIYVDEQPKDGGKKEQEKKDSEMKNDGKSKEVANSDQTQLPPPPQATGSSAMQQQAASSLMLGRDSAPAQLGAPQGPAGSNLLKACVWQASRR